MLDPAHILPHGGLFSILPCKIYRTILKDPCGTTAKTLRTVETIVTARWNFMMDADGLMTLTCLRCGTTISIHRNYSSPQKWAEIKAQHEEECHFIQTVGLQGALEIRYGKPTQSV